MRTDPSTSAHSQSRPEIPAAGDVQLNLKSILKGLSASKLGFDPDKIPANVVTELPMAVILPQLKSGKVELPLETIIEGCLERYRPAFSKADLSEKVQLPVQEIYQKMPQGMDPESDPPRSSPLAGSNPFTTADKPAVPSSPFSTATSPSRNADSRDKESSPRSETPQGAPAPKSPFQTAAGQPNFSPFATSSSSDRTIGSPFGEGNADKAQPSSPFSTASSPFSPVRDNPAPSSPFHAVENPPTSEKPKPTDEESRSQREISSPSSPFSAISESLEARSASEATPFPKGLFTPRPTSEDTPPPHSPFDVAKPSEAPKESGSPFAPVESTPPVSSSPTAPKTEDSLFNRPAPQKDPAPTNSPFTSSNTPPPPAVRAPFGETKREPQAIESPKEASSVPLTPPTTQAPPATSPFGKGEATPPAFPTKFGGQTGSAPSTEVKPAPRTSPEPEEKKSTQPASKVSEEASKGRGFDFGFQENPEQLVLRALFDTDETLTAEEVMNRTQLLEGLRACVMIDKKTEKTTLGKGDNIPASFEHQAKQAFSKVLSLAEDLQIENAESFTLRSAQGAMSFFNAEHVCLTVLHQEPFAGGLREKLILIARELSDMQG